TGRCHSATGGEAVQSVLIRTPGMMSSRWGPRKPGHSATGSGGIDDSGTGAPPALATSCFSGATAAERTGESAAGSLAVLDAACALSSFSGVVTAAVAGGIAGVDGSAPSSFPDLATNRSSDVFVHLQCKSFLKVAAVKPPVLTSAQNPQARKMVATIVARRTPSERRRVVTA